MRLCCRHFRARFRPRVAALLALVLLLGTSTASARKRGFSAGACEGCHGATDNSSLSIAPLTATPGETITLQIILSDSDAKVAGLFVETDDLPGVSVSSSQTIVVVSNGVTHPNPVPLSGGSVTFSLTYQVPSTPGATQFSVWTVAANQNDDDTGDEANQASFGLVYGCEPQTFYADMDGDGHGRDAPTRTHCSGTPPTGFAPAPDDCNDNDQDESPSAAELCNDIDDNCNGEVDEGAVPVELFPDADGDGYYSYAEWQSGDSVIGCLPYPGYAVKPGDCEPNAANAHPGGEEVCDMRLDEDCDGSVDERVKPVCGEGACSRQSATCDLDACVPGEPSPEICNFFDDDCDGDLDEGELCPVGQECLAGTCREAGSIVPPNPGDSEATGGSTSAPGSGGSAEPTTPETKATDNGASSSCRVSAPGARVAHSAWLPWLFGLLALALLRKRRLMIG